MPARVPNARCDVLGDGARSLAQTPRQLKGDGRAQVTQFASRWVVECHRWQACFIEGIQSREQMSHVGAEAMMNRENHE